MLCVGGILGGCGYDQVVQTWVAYSEEPSVPEGPKLPGHVYLLRGRYSGLCQPDYVLDIPGGHGKSPVGPNYLSADGGEIEDFRGQRHRYRP